MKPDRAAKEWFSTDDSGRLTACGETPAVVRKKILLRILARREAERGKMNITDADVQVTSEQFRQEFGLSAPQDLARWLEQQGLTDADYFNAIRDFTIIRLLEEANAGEIEELAKDHIAISAARLRRA